MSGTGGGGSIPLDTLGPCAPAVLARLRGWDATGASARIWQKDPTFWPEAAPSDVSGRLGWLSIPTNENHLIADLESFAEEVRREGVTDVVVLGMGGSSLAPQVYAHTFAARSGFPRLRVLDSTHPAAVRELRDRIDPRQTLFVVSSKSGTTLEPNAYMAYFWAEVERAGGAPAHQFVAITDPGTALDRLATERGFRWVCRAPSDVGGRYSALTVFGLVPAALMGVDVRALLARAATMAGACGPSVAASAHPALTLAAAIGESALAGADKLVFLTSPSLAAFPSWGEQLVAESTGKQGKGIVPVADEVDVLDPMGRDDRLLVYLHLRGEADPTFEPQLDTLAATGAPLVRIELADRLDLGAEFFRWEMAIAAAGAVLGIDPFDQPDVELAKDLARQALAATGGTGGPAPGPVVDSSERSAVREALDAWAETLPAGGYVAVQAYLAPGVAMSAALQGLRGAIRRRLGSSTTLGYGPRFLHSTGQLHKGGPPTGLFLQLVDRGSPDLPVPGMDATFGRIIRAQAAGDAAALRQRGRSLLTIDLGGEGSTGVGQLADAVHG